MCAASIFFGPFRANEEMDHKNADAADVYIIPLHELQRKYEIHSQTKHGECFIEDNLAAHGSSGTIMEDALIIDECFVFVRETAEGFMSRRL